MKLEWWKKIKNFFGEFISVLLILILTAFVSLIVGWLRFDQVSKLDPDITLYNYKDPIVSHLFIYGVVIFSITMILPMAIFLIIGLGLALLDIIEFLIEYITWKGLIYFILILALITIIGTLVWFIWSIGLDSINNLTNNC